MGLNKDAIETSLQTVKNETSTIKTILDIQDKGQKIMSLTEKLDLIERVAGMRDKGLLTDQEFAKIKELIISQSES